MAPQNGTNVYLALTNECGWLHTFLVKHRYCCTIAVKKVVWLLRFYHWLEIYAHKYTEVLIYLLVIKIDVDVKDKNFRKHKKIQSSYYISGASYTY